MGLLDRTLDFSDSEVTNRNRLHRLDDGLIEPDGVLLLPLPDRLALVPPALPFGAKGH